MPVHVCACRDVVILDLHFALMDRNRSGQRFWTPTPASPGESQVTTSFPKTPGTDPLLEEQLGLCEIR